MPDFTLRYKVLHMTGLELFGEDTPSAARRLLFRDSIGTETAGEVVTWWEKRRLLFNVAVGTAGIASLGSILMANAVHAPSGGGVPFIAVVVYGLVANFCYTGGWIAELLLRPVFGRRTGTVGATIFRYGLAFSVVLTLLPIPISLISIVLRALSEMLN